MILILSITEDHKVYQNQYFKCNFQTWNGFIWPAGTRLIFIEFIKDSIKALVPYPGSAVKVPDLFSLSSKTCSDPWKSQVNSLKRLCSYLATVLLVLVIFNVRLNQFLVPFESIINLIWSSATFFFSQSGFWKSRFSLFNYKFDQLKFLL
jgi:hypothetical protein